MNNKAIKIVDNIYWVGAKDWNIRDFHGYKTQRGTSYNAYLIIDDKITLVDTVKETLKDEMFERISSIIEPSKIDIIVSNHVEMDHSGSIKDVLKLAPNAKVLTSTSGEKGLKMHYDISNWNLQVIKSGENLNIGKKTLSFVHVPMVHWPDNMVTYVAEDKLLLPNDAFGQHYATYDLFVNNENKNIIFEEAAKYYANIVLPYGMQVKKALAALASLDIKIIAPSHGLIWKDYLSEIMEKYHFWADYSCSSKALVVYDTMWGSTEIIAKNIKSVFEEQSIPVVVRSLKDTHISDVMTDVLESKYIAIGTPVLNTNILPNMAAFLAYLEGLKPKNKITFLFGSYGWAEQGLKKMSDVITSLSWEQPSKPFYSQFKPTADFLSQVKKDLGNILKK